MHYCLVWDIIQASSAANETCYYHDGTTFRIGTHTSTDPASELSSLGVKKNVSHYELYEALPIKSNKENLTVMYECNYEDHYIITAVIKCGGLKNVMQVLCPVTPCYSSPP